MFPRQITQARILQVLLAGFTLVIVLLVTAAFVGVQNIRSIQENAAALVREQRVTNRLIDEIQRQQVSLSEIFAVLARDPDSIDADKILAQLDEADRNIDRVAAEGSQTPQKHTWEHLRQSSRAFSAEARHLLTAENLETYASRDLFRLHAEFTSVIARLIEISYRKVISAQEQIDRRSARLLQQSLALLSACLLLALVSTILTVRMTTHLFRRMEEQAGELSRVSWHMLENQESTARRFSHELHDELGQSLTAVKANLMALDSNSSRIRLDDCIRLVDEAIGNVRQLSQLLRPTILDDFGLEAGIRWLCEGFTTRTGIEVDFRSILSGRLPDETETHLFRIAQEALTNVARHSGATRVWVRLENRGQRAYLSIKDNGRGFASARGEGLGMIGMRARARSAGGDVTVRSRDGVLIEVWVPVMGATHERQDPHPVG